MGRTLRSPHRRLYGSALWTSQTKAQRSARMETPEPKKSRPSVRKRADAIKDFRCKNLIAVIEDPADIKNIGTVIRNVNALGVEKAYVVDPKGALPDDWQDMRERRALSGTSVSAIKWTFVKRFDSTEACLEHLRKKGFASVVTSPMSKARPVSTCMRATTRSSPSSPSGSATRSAGSVIWPSHRPRCAWPSRCSG